MNCDKHDWLSPYVNCPQCKALKDKIEKLREQQLALGEDHLVMDACETIIDAGITLLSPSAVPNLDTPVDSSWDGGGGDFSGGGSSEDF